MISQKTITTKQNTFFLFIITILISVISCFRGAFGSDTKKASDKTSNKVALTPEMFAMPRTDMAFVSDRMIRLFNGNGSISIRDKSITGLQTLFFPPIDVRDYLAKKRIHKTHSNWNFTDLSICDKFIQIILHPCPEKIFKVQWNWT